MTDTAPQHVDSLYAPPTADGPGPSVQRRPPPATFFAVSPLKLVLMSITTLGIYELFWFYANWQRLRRRGRPRISPFWRTMFAHITAYSLFKHVSDTAESANIRPRFNPLFMAIGWAITSFMWKLPNAAWLLCYAAVLFLVPVQTTMNEVNQALDPGHDPNTRFTVWNILGLVAGGILLALAVWGSFLPDSPP